MNASPNTAVVLRLEELLGKAGPFQVNCATDLIGWRAFFVFAYEQAERDGAGEPVGQTLKTACLYGLLLLGFIESRCGMVNLDGVPMPQLNSNGHDAAPAASVSSVVKGDRDPDARQPDLYTQAEPSQGAPT